MCFPPSSFLIYERNLCFFIFPEKNNPGIYPGAIFSLLLQSAFSTINEQIQNIAQKKDTLCRRMYN